MPDKIKIDKTFFLTAFENNSYDSDNYLDIETGDIISLGDIFDVEIDREEVENNPDKFYYINSIDSSESYKIMEDFIEAIDNDKIKNDLSNSINMRKPFRSFKDRLYNYPKIQEKWYEFYDNKLEKIMLEWLKEKNIDAELI